MTQDVVTARDAAAPSEDAIQKQDLQRICEVLDGALAHDGYRRPQYSEQIESLLKLAWAVAAHKRSRQVNLFHLAYALVFDRPEAASNLVEFLGSDIDSLAVGCILKSLALGVSTGDAEVLPPAVAVVRWLGHAEMLARTRKQHSALVPEDLVEVVRDGSIPASELSSLRSAARVGAARRDAVLGLKTASPGTTQVVDPIGYIDDIAAGRDTTASLDGLADLVAEFEDFDQRYSAYAAEQKQAMTAVRGDMAKLAAQVAPIDEAARSVNGLENKLAALAASLPRPPSGRQIASAIVAVLALGSLAGVALTFLQPTQGATPAAVVGK